MSRDARLLPLAVGASSAGDFLLWIPLALHLQAATGSGFALAALFLALWAPAAALAPVAGRLADRREARGVLLATAVAQVAIATAMAFALGSTAAIVALALLLGTANAIGQPAEFALVQAIGDEDERRRVTGHVESARSVGATAGPALGGVLAGVGGTEAALLVDAASFALLALAALALTTRRPPAPHEPGERARDGFTHLVRDPELGRVVRVQGVALLFMTAIVVADVVFLKEDVGVSDATYGALFAMWTLGMVAGASAVARRVPVALVATGAMVAVAVQGAGVGAPAIAPSVALTAVAFAIGGAAHGTKNVLVRTLIGERVPAQLHGRAYAAYNGLRNGAELVALGTGGVLVAAIGGHATLAIAGAVPVAAALAGLALHRARPVRAPAPAPA